MEGTETTDSTATRRKSEGIPPSVAPEIGNPTAEVRRKSLGLLRDITSQWASKEKYTLSEEIVEPDVENAAIPPEKSSVVPVTTTPPVIPVTTSMTPMVSSGQESVSTAVASGVVALAGSGIPSSVSGVGEGGSRVRKPETGSLSKRKIPSTPTAPTTTLKMSSMEEESMRDRLRTMLLRQCAQFLEIEGVSTKFSKDSFRRSFLNKVNSFTFSFHL